MGCRLVDVLVDMALRRREPIVGVAVVTIVVAVPVDVPGGFVRMLVIVPFAVQEP